MYGLKFIVIDTICSTLGTEILFGDQKGGRLSGYLGARLMFVDTDFSILPDQLHSYTMLPFDVDIKMLALNNILRRRLDYIKEVEERKTQLKQMLSQKNEPEFEQRVFNSLRRILTETEELRRMSDKKVIEIADDVRPYCEGDTSDSTKLLMAEADLIRSVDT